MNKKTLGKVIFSLATFLSVGTLLNPAASGEASAKEIGSAVKQEAVSDSYYESCRGLSGSSLLSALTTLTKSKHTTSVSYSGLRNYYLSTDVDPNNSSHILGYYTGTSFAFSGTFGSSGGGVNREHVWPQSYLGSYTQTGPGSDLFNVHPCEVRLNSTRGNLYYAELTSGTYAKEYTSTSAYTTTGCLYNSTSFCPETAYKGDVARSVFYVATRYASYGYTVGESPNASSLIMGKLSALLDWNEDLEPTAAEIARNEAVEDVQGNRNPFIDHPEFATMIWDSSYSGSGALEDSGSSSGGSSTTVSVTSVSLNKSTTSIAVGGTTTLTATVLPTNASNKTVTWSTSNATVATVSSGVVTGVAAGSATITVKTSDGSYKATCVVTVTSSSSSSTTSYTVNASGLGLVTTSYAANNATHTSNSISYVTYQVMKNSSSYMQFKKSKGYIYNSTAYGSNISKIVVTMASSYSGTVKMYSGTSSNPSSTTVTALISSNTYTYTFSGSYKYFKFGTPSLVMYVSSVVVYLA